MLRSRLFTSALCRLHAVPKHAVASSGSSQQPQAQSRDGAAADPTGQFARSETGPFYQQPPTLGNQFLEDMTLRRYLKRVLPREVFTDITPDLERFGDRVAKEVNLLGEQCERDPPHLQHFHAWGQRVDAIITCQAWKDQKSVSAEEGLIATAYKKKHGAWSRLHQVVKMYLYAPSSGLFSCPLAMTDGAAKIIESLGDSRLSNAYDHLTTTDPAEFWTSGQWMTERRGGSDVGGSTETVAIDQEDGTFKLYGYKWFSSATDSDVSFTLARVVDKEGNTVEGSGGLSMFFLRVRDADGILNNIEVQRLKDKLGTRQLPTGEILMDGSRAFLVSDEGRGVAAIAQMLTITRIHNCISATAAIRRISSLARNYSQRRRAFGGSISENPLHVRTLAKLEVEQRASLLFVLELGTLLGRMDVGIATPVEEKLLRLLTPIGKLYTAKQAVAMVSEGLESFGGAGYIEDTGIPRMLRDAQVLPIWEGTTNVLSNDVLRAVSKSDGEVLQAFHSEVVTRLTVAQLHKELAPSAEKLKQSVGDVMSFASANADSLLVTARDFAYSLARIYMGMLLVEHACWTEATPQDVYAAKRWCQQDLVPVITEYNANGYSRESTDLDKDLVFDGCLPP